MKLKLLLTFLFLGIIHFAVGQAKLMQKPIDPTGSYKLVSNAKIKNGDVYGYSGDIEVKLLDSSRIAISFFVTKGMPSYNSGSFIDTLFFRDNIGTYKTKEDSTCTMTFRFSAKGIKVEEKTADYNFGCGFGHAVVADGFYKKTSSKIPKNENFLEQ
jgi:hypothetical protein